VLLPTRYGSTGMILPPTEIEEVRRKGSIFPGTVDGVTGYNIEDGGEDYSSDR
jgi:hypothetical protein